METTQERQLPTADEGKNLAMSNPWRIVKGELHRGREADETLETRKTITGRIRAMQFNSGTGDDGKVYQYAAVVLESADEGMAKVHTSLTSKVSASTLMEGLCQCKIGDDITISPNLGTAKNGMSAPTYTNVSRYNEATGTWQKCKGAEFKDVDAWLEEFLEHPGVTERTKDTDTAPVQDEFADTPLDKISQYIMERSWPAFEVYPDAWGKVFDKLLEHDKDNWRGKMTEGHFQKLEKGLNDLKEAPKTVRDAVAAGIKSTQLSAEDL